MITELKNIIFQNCFRLPKTLIMVFKRLPVTIISKLNYNRVPVFKKG